jgi:pimeloyl-ACP methyl ester carboxylesterase
VLKLLRVAVCLVLVCVVAAGQTRSVAAQVSVPALRAAGGRAVRDVYVRPPSTLPEAQPVRVVLALHGIGDNGPNFGGALAAHADRYGWLVIAPTIEYGDWTDVSQIRREDPALVVWLSAFLADLRDNSGYAIHERVLVYGHSRGAQLALRFAKIRPEQVAGVAALSAGTYTLPLTHDASSGRPLEFPFGMANMARDVSGSAFDRGAFKRVPVWIGVGANDTNPNDVPNAWDPYIGDDRLDRARAYARALRDLGVPVILDVFPGAGHATTEEMRATALAALAAST